MDKLLSTFTLEECLNKSFSCDCGRVHTSELAAVSIGSGALNTLPSLMTQFGWKNPYLICDSMTYEIAGKQVEEILTQAGYSVNCRVLSHVGFDEATLGELVIHMVPQCDVVFGVGTGSINDMCRYFSFKMNRAYGCIATAAPMDGFASSISALMVDNLKTTYEVKMPTLIVGDVDILKNAPARMIAAGLGDLIGKFTCLCDWKLSRLINNEYYCDTVVTMVEKNIQSVLSGADKAKDRDPEVIGSIMTGLVLTGVCMGLIGNSRPASGCEHHISHFWEMWFEQQGKRPVPHGTQVGVGTILILKLTEALRKKTINFDKARACARDYDEEQWKKEITAAYGPAAPGIIELEAKAKKNETAGRLRRIDFMEQNWEQVSALLNALPSSEKIAEILQSLNSSYLPRQIDVDQELLRTTLRYCKEVRNRYTILQMIWDLGLLDDCIDDVIKELD